MNSYSFQLWFHLGLEDFRGYSIFTGNILTLSSIVKHQFKKLNNETKRRENVGKVPKVIE